MNKKSIIILIIFILAIGGFLMYRNSKKISLPKGESVIIEEIPTSNTPQKKIFETDGVRHSVPLDEILSGGASKRWHSPN